LTTDRPGGEFSSVDVDVVTARIGDNRSHHSSVTGNTAITETVRPIKVDDDPTGYVSATFVNMCGHHRIDPIGCDSETHLRRIQVNDNGRRAGSVGITRIANRVLSAEIRREIIQMDICASRQSTGNQKHNHKRHDTNISSHNHQLLR
jgi:hypothetical protein